MFSFFQKIMFSLSAISPLLLCGAFVWWYQGEYPEYALAALVASIVFFLLGGLLFIWLAKRFGEPLTIASGQISTVSPGGQWLSVLFGSYLVPILGFLGDGLQPVVFVSVLTIVAFLAAWLASVPPAAFLLLFGYRFYEVGFCNGAQGFRLISKRKSILDPNKITKVIFLFKDDTWLLEEE